MIISLMIHQTILVNHNNLQGFLNQRQNCFCRLDKVYDYYAGTDKLLGS